MHFKTEIKQPFRKSDDINLQCAVKLGHNDNGSVTSVTVDQMLYKAIINNFIRADGHNETFSCSYSTQRPQTLDFIALQQGVLLISLVNMNT